MRSSTILLLALLAAGLTRSEPLPAAEPIATRVDRAIKGSPFAQGHWGLLAVDAETGRVVYERNPDELFCPASVTKLFSTAAALVDLGADYRFETPVVRRGEIDAKGALKGDLILIAKGDLTLGGRSASDGKTLGFTDNDHTYSGGNLDATLVDADPLSGLKDLARQVRSAGVQSVSGDVLVDDRLFNQATSSGSGPTRVSTIVINDNVVDVVVSPGDAPGKPARVRIVPETAFVSHDAFVETFPADGKTTISVSNVGPRRFTVKGGIALGRKEVVKIHEVDDPASFARALFIECLRKEGVRVSASALGSNDSTALPAKDAAGKLPRVATFRSPEFIENIKVILKVSHNLHASTLPLLIAANHGETSVIDGLRREGKILSGLGLEPGSVSFGGGAGGERADLVSPRATVKLLKALSARPDFARYEAALPVLGEDGTLSKAVPKSSPARGKARAKTGTYWVDNRLNGKAVLTSKALAGTLETASGRRLLFAFFVNSVAIDAPSDDVTPVSAKAGQVLGALCELFHDDKHAD